MKEGKKVRRLVWSRMPRCEDRFIEIPQKYNYFRNHKGYSVTISYDEFFATDWEVYEPESIKHVDVSEEPQANTQTYGNDIEGKPDCCEESTDTESLLRGLNEIVEGRVKQWDTKERTEKLLDECQKIKNKYAIEYVKDETIEVIRLLQKENYEIINDMRKILNDLEELRKKYFPEEQE